MHVSSQCEGTGTGNSDDFVTDHIIPLNGLSLNGLDIGRLSI